MRKIEIIKIKRLTGEVEYCVKAVKKKKFLWVIPYDYVAYIAEDDLQLPSSRHPLLTEDVKKIKMFSNFDQATSESIKLANRFHKKEIVSKEVVNSFEF